MKTDNFAEIGTGSPSSYHEDDVGLLSTSPSQRKAGSLLSDVDLNCVGKIPKKVPSKDADSRMMTILLIVLNIFLLVLVIVTAVFMGKERDNYRKKSQFCVLCSDVRLHPYVTMDEFEFSQNDTLCCLKDETNLDSLVRKFTEHWYNAQLAKENPRFSLCSDGQSKNRSWLKVQRVLPRNDDTIGTTHSIVRWDIVHGSSGDLTYSDGYITIHDSGVYHIYSQLMRDRFTSKKARLLTHRVVLARKGYEEHERVIIDSTRSECKRNGTITWDTSYVATTYELLRGDMIAVRVDSEDRIMNGDRQNYFGVNRI